MPLDFPSSPSTNQTYSFGGATWKYDGSKWNLVTNLVPSYETTLPSPAVDGQEIYYQASGDMATNGTVWHLRYRSNSSSSYKWEYVGGGSLYSSANTERTVTNQTSYVDVPTDPITITMPLAGEYDVTQGALLRVTTTGAGLGLTGLAITNASNVVQTATNEADAIAFENNNSAYIIASIFGRNKFTVTTAGWKLREQIRTGGNYSVGTFRRRVYVTPMRVG